MANPMMMMNPVTLDKIGDIEEKLAEAMKSISENSYVGMQAFMANNAFPYLGSYVRYFRVQQDQSQHQKIYKVYVTIDCFLESNGNPLDDGDDMLHLIEVRLDEFFKDNKTEGLVLSNCTVIEVDLKEIRDRYCLATVDVEISYYGSND